MMARSHSRHAQKATPEKPAAPPPPAEGPPPDPASTRVDSPELRLGYRLALVVWLAAFIALMAWMCFDLLLGLLGKG
jgi:hypothetical protein